MRIKDSARSWVVLAVATFSMFLEVGTIKSFSVLLPDLQQQLNTQTWIVGSSIAIMTGFGYIAGLSAGAFVKFLEPRTCIIMSGFLAGIGIIISSLATNPLTLLLGLVLAGFLLVQETFVVGIIPEFFDKYYEAAVGIYTSGTAFGILIIPLLTQYLLDMYGWRGTILLLSGLVLHSVPFGGLVRFPKEHDLKENKPLVDSSGDKSAESEFGNENKNANNGTYSKSIISKALGISLMTEIGFITRVFFPALASGYNLTGWMIYMVSYAESNGATLKEATIVVTCGGVGVFVSRALGTPILHRFVTYKQQLYVSSIVMTISLLLMTIFKSFTGMSVMSSIYGAAMGLFGTEVFISAKVNSQESEHFQAIAWLNLAYGIASLFSGFVTGVFFDMTKSFTVSFIILAAVSATTIISLGIGDILKK